MITQEPKTTPRRVCFVGFDSPTLAQASSITSTLGYQIIGVAQLSDLIVFAPGVSSFKEVLGDRAPDCLGKPTCTYQEFLAKFAGMATSGDEVTSMETRPWFIQKEQTVDVLGIELPIYSGSPQQGSAIPSKHVTSICYDQPTLDLMTALATGWCSGLDLMVEGATSSAKTTACLVLAAVLGYPMWRLNFGSSSTESDMVGRYVPSTTTGGWQFIEGPLTRWMRVTEPNHILLLDELNMIGAGTASLEGKLNSILDYPGSMVLSEYDFSRLERPQGSKLVSTLNVGYAGRNVLSPALTSRFTNIVAHIGGELEWSHQVNWMLTGANPTVIKNGIAYKAPDEQNAPFAELCEDFLPFSQSIARIHQQLAAATGSNGDTPSIGRNRKQRYTITRRQLWSLFRTLKVVRHQYKSPKQAIRAAIDFTYCNGMEEQDCRMAHQIIGATL
jgi:hypothetical protein